jgi:hypothetical protein
MKAFCLSDRSIGRLSDYTHQIPGREGDKRELIDLQEAGERVSQRCNRTIIDSCNPVEFTQEKAARPPSGCPIPMPRNLIGRRDSATLKRGDREWQTLNSQQATPQPGLAAHPRQALFAV